MQKHFEDIATKFFSWAVLTLEKKIPLLFSTPDISATSAKISITINLNVSSSRIFNPENCYMLIIKLDLRLRSNLVFHYISLDTGRKWNTPDVSWMSVLCMFNLRPISRGIIQESLSLCFLTLRNSTIKIKAGKDFKKPKAH